MVSSGRVGDFVSLVRGKTYKGAQVGTEGPALLGLGSITPGGGFRNDYKTYGGECPPELMLTPGDLFVSLKGATKDGEMIGSIARLPLSVPSGRLTQDTVKLVFNERNADFERYLYWLLRTPDYRSYCAGRATGSAVVALSREDFLSYPVPDLTPIRLQIVEVLEHIDDKIESNRRAVVEISDLIDAHSEKHGAELPAVPLGDIATSIKDSVNPSKLGDAVVDHFSLPAFDSGARPEHVAAATIKSNKLRVPQRAVLLSRLNPRFNRTWWASAGAETWALASTEFLVLTSEDALELAAVWLAVRDPFFREELPKRVTGTSGSHQRVRPDDVLTIEVPDFRSAAPEVKQSTLALLMRAESLRVESDRLTALRDTLLPELLSGRMRVPAEGVAA